MRRRKFSVGPFLIPAFVLAVFAFCALSVPPFRPATSGGCTGVSGANGVIIDASGVLRMQQFSDPTGQLMRRRMAEARATLNPQVAKSSKLRKVSLNRLEAAIRAELEQKRGPSEEMQFLAGLTRVSYVFYYPETKDIVLAGPAEGWAADLMGIPRGIDSGRPMLELQDLIVALRAYPPQGRGASAILCSIDPTQEGQVRLNQFLGSVGRTINANDEDSIVHGIRTSLGMQSVRFGGISPTTHMAKVLLECDYRMKLIGIGAEEPPVRMASYVDQAQPSANRNAMERWYFVPEPKSVRIAADSLGLELTGDGVKLVSENQMVAADGSRNATGKSNRASDTFAQTFTTKYKEIATYLPVFAQMRNCIDLTIAAAFIHQQDFYGKSGWQATTFNDENSLAVETLNAPTQVETVCTAIWKGNTLMTPLGGGVTIRPRDALKSENRLADDSGKISELRESIDLDKLPAGRWWWD